MKMISIIAVGLLALAGLFAAYVRLAPVTAGDWHTALPTDTRPLEGDNCADGVTVGARGAIASCMALGSAQQVLERLNIKALASPRTRLIAGSPAEGLMTWETRSKLWSFPDYTTAQAHTTGTTTRLDVLARQRFGKEDGGVNAARLRNWLSGL